MANQYWLMKSEPSVFSIDDLIQSPNQTTAWEGVRNYQARNFMRDQFQLGDLVLFYHSNTNPPGIVGTCKVVKTAYPDPTAFDKNSIYYDSKSLKEKPRWFLVDIQFQTKLKSMITLETIKTHPILQNMQVAKKGNRLSITPVSKKEWEVILKFNNLN